MVVGHREWVVSRLKKNLDAKHEEPEATDGIYGSSTFLVSYSPSPPNSGFINLVPRGKSEPVPSSAT